MLEIEMLRTHNLYCVRVKEGALATSPAGYLGALRSLMEHLERQGEDVGSASECDCDCECDK